VTLERRRFLQNMLAVWKSFRKHIEPAVLAAVFLTVCAGAAFGQMNTGEISGLVKDPSGASIPNARVEAMESTTQVKYTAVSNASGEFLLAQLPVGQYAITVNATGFQQAVQPGIAVHAGEKLRQDFSLRLGEETQIETVTTAPGLLQTQSAAINDTIEQRQVIDLPLKGRNFIDLVGLAPGVTNPPAGTRGSALQQTGNSYGVLGQRSGHNLYLVDGVSVTDEFYNNMVLNPSVDDVQEVNIGETSYDAEFGGKSGSVINVITKSGGNALHGSAFEFVRNDIFDAENYFVPSTESKPPFKQNQFGASVGGPIRRNKTFFFLDYEGVRIRQSQTQLFTVPTPLERTGNFTGSGITVDIPGTKTMFPNDTIPAVDPVAAALLARIPLPSSAAASNNLNETALSPMDANQYNARIDQTFGANDNAFVRMSVFDANQFLPFGSSALSEALFPAFGYNLRTHTDSLSATWNHIFSPSWVNELRFGWMWVGGGEISPNAGTNFAGQTALQGVTSNPLDSGFPDVSVTGFSALGEPTQYVTREDSNYEAYDNVIWHRGTHTVKFGGYFFHLNFDPVNAQNARGTFAFTGKWTGNALGDFMLGDPNQGTVGVLGRGNILGRSNWGQFYLEDGWQITPSFHLDIGLRYEYNQNVTDASNRMSIVNTLVPGGEYVIASNAANQISPSAAPLLADIPIPYVTSTELGWDPSLIISRPLRLAPRVGIAWSLPDKKTVIRSAFGIYTNQAAYSVIQLAALNLPFYFAKTVTNTSVAGAPGFDTENILAAPANGSVSANNVDHNYKVEYNNVWNLSVERSFSSTTAFQAQYIGSRTVHADNETYQNFFPDNALPPGPNHARSIPSMSGFPAVVWNGWEQYNALALTFTQRLWRGLSASANYTWSKALDIASNPGPDNAGPNFPQDPSNLAAEKGLSDFDHRNRFVTNFLYQLPFLKGSQGWVHTAFGEWEVGGIWTLQSGSPFTVNLSSDVANNGEPLTAPSQRPNVICNPNDGPRTPAEWFNTSCFTMPAAYTYGNAGRDIVIGPGVDDFDATLQKQFMIREDMGLQFRLDVFNFVNHPNFNAPIGASRTFSPSSSFGAITSAQDPREMQFSLRLVF
jgi:carboxypeptidase family protein